MRVSFLVFVAVMYAVSFADGHVGSVRFRHQRRGVGDAVADSAGVGSTGGGQPRLGGNYDPSTATGASTDPVQGGHKAEYSQSNQDHQTTGAMTAESGFGSGTSSSSNSGGEQGADGDSATTSGDAGSKQGVTADNTGDSGDNAQQSTARPTSAKDKLDQPSPGNTGEQGGLLGGEDDQSTPLPVTHNSYGVYPNSGSAFQHFYAFSPYVYVSSLVATGAPSAKSQQTAAPLVTLGVCRCERPYATIADAQGSPDKNDNYGISPCLNNVMTASSTSAQCHDVGIDQKQCIENGVPPQLDSGDKLWWQKTFCKRCVDAGGVSDPQFACPDNYLNTGSVGGSGDSDPISQGADGAGGLQ